MLVKCRVNREGIRSGIKGGAMTIRGFNAADKGSDSVHIGKSSAANVNCLGSKPKSCTASVWPNTKSLFIRSAMAADHCR